MRTNPQPSPIHRKVPVLPMPVSLRRFLKKNPPRCGPRQRGRTPCLPPAGGGWRGEHVDGVLSHAPPPAGPPPRPPPPGGGHPPHNGVGGRRAGGARRG